MATRNLLNNPVVIIVLASVVILVIATLSFATAISGALNIVRYIPILGSILINVLLYVQTAERLRNPLDSLNSYHSGISSRIDRIGVGSQKDRRLKFPINFAISIPSAISLKFK